MTKQEITKKLEENHLEFINYIVSLKDEEFLLSQNEKWTAGQQLEHIYLSVKPLNQLALLPTFVLKWIFGKANRPSKSYKELVAKYNSKLEQGGRASGRFVPKPVAIAQKAHLAKLLRETVRKLIYLVDGFSEQQLDTLILPHPLLGKLTLREMLYFTIHHVSHHLQMTKRNLGQD